MLTVIVLASSHDPSKVCNQQTLILAMAEQLERQQSSDDDSESECVSLLRCVLPVACKGFVVGAGLHVGQVLIGGVVSRKLFKNPRKVLSGVVSLDTARFASFIALSGSTYKLVLTVLKKRFKNLGGWSAILAGLAAGAVSVIDDPERRRTLSLFVLARALGSLVMTLHRRGYLPKVPYFATLVFAACQSLIILCMTHFPELLPQGYYRSILNWSMYYTDEKLQVYFRRPHSQFIPCTDLMHPGLTCHQCARIDFYKGLLLYLKIYLTIYSLPLVLFRTKNLISKTKESAVTLLKNSVVSALFFAVDATVVKYGLCLLRNAWGNPPLAPYFVPLLAGFLGSLGILIERQSRRVELLYYVLPQVFYGFWRILCIKKPLGLHKIPYGSVIVFCLSFMAIMHAYEREKQSISPLINRSLNFLLGD